MDIQVHVFVDGSEEAFAAAAYLRCKSLESISTTLIIAKARTASIKSTVSIPRMELQAAVLGCRLSQSLDAELDIKVNSYHFWSDSKIVLHWIKDDSNLYKQFVANRISEIRDGSNISDWRWVPTKLNAADLATRSKTTFCEKKFNIWLQGPDFLRRDEKDWPQQPDCHLLDSTYDVELKKNFLGLTIENLEVLPISKFSSWMKLLRCTAWIFRYIKKL